MNSYQLTCKAEAEIEEICDTAIRNFGPSVARQYVFGLQERIEALACSALDGQDFGRVRPGLLRFEYLSHSIYYERSETGLLVLRVVAGKTDPAQSL